MSADQVQACTAAAHCYHDSPNVLMSHPPQYQKVCCHCNHTVTYRPEPYRLPGDHGPFFRG